MRLPHDDDAALTHPEARDESSTLALPSSPPEAGDGATRQVRARRRLRAANWQRTMSHMASIGADERTQAERIYVLLGGGRAARLRQPSMLALHEAAERGLGVAAVDALQENLGAARGELLRAMALSLRTLARRRDEGVLSPEESDRALRVARIAALAEDVLGGQEEAVAWLKASNRSLGGRVPMDLLRTDAGASMLADVLGRLEHGVFG